MACRSICCCTASGSSPMRCSISATESCWPVAKSKHQPREYPGVRAAVVAEHHEHAVAVPVGVPVDVGLRAPLVLLRLDLRAVLVLSEVCRIHGGKLIVEMGSIRAVAFQLRHMDVQPVGDAPIVPDGLFQRELLGDAVFLCRLHRRVCGALGSCAGACGGSGSRCAAAPASTTAAASTAAARRLCFMVVLLCSQP